MASKKLPPPMVVGFEVEGCLVAPVGDVKPEKGAGFAWGVGEAPNDSDPNASSIPLSACEFEVDRVDACMPPNADAFAVG